MKSYAVLLRRNGSRAMGVYGIIIAFVGVVLVVSIRFGYLPSEGEVGGAFGFGAALASGFVLGVQVLPGLASWMHAGVTRNALLGYLLTLCGVLALASGAYLWLINMIVEGSTEHGQVSFLSGFGVVATIALTATAMWALVTWAKWPGFVAVIGFFLAYSGIASSLRDTTQRWTFVLTWGMLAGVIAIAVKRMPS